MSEKTLYRDESVFTWLIYTNLLLPWEKKNTGVAKFVAQVPKNKSSNPKMDMCEIIYIHVFKLYCFFQIGVLNGTSLHFSVQEYLFSVRVSRD